MKIETNCLHAGYNPGNGDPRVVPIVQSTTYTYNSTERIADIFDDPTKGLIYSRFANPTCDAVEKKIAALEGGVGAMLTTSGQAASLLSVLNVCSAGDSFLSTTTIYGGTINLFGFTLKKLGIECIWIDQNASEDEIQALIKPNTKAIFGETLANPALQVCDIEKLSKIAHKNFIPFIIDNTFPTPILCRPFEWGADIIVHSTTKYMEGHATQGGGVIIDSGKFDWKAAYEATGKFADFVEPDESYHGLCYTEKYGNMAYILKARMQLMRDFGCYPAAHSAFLLNLGLETLAVRMKRCCENALAVANYFASRTDVIEKVSYPGLENDKYFDLAKKYLKDGASGVISVSIKGGRSAAVRFMDGLKLASNVVHVADIRTCVLHPAAETHRQLTDEQLIAAGIDGGMIRFSTGLENIDDILADVEQALNAV